MGGKGGGVGSGPGLLHRGAGPASRVGPPPAALAGPRDRAAMPWAEAESRRQRLAALAYQLEGSPGESFHLLLAGYATQFRRSAAAGEPLAVPRLTEVLDDPAFAPLDDW